MFFTFLKYFDLFDCLPGDQQTMFLRIGNKILFYKRPQSPFNFRNSSFNPDSFLTLIFLSWRIFLIAGA
jgi:hypothetical protein